tara:strand:- start:1381 stop:1593 length:213 start_codon:yes stop_codon:yes gene_type:complete
MKVSPPATDSCWCPDLSPHRTAIWATAPFPDGPEAQFDSDLYVSPHGLGGISLRMTRLLHLAAMGTLDPP